MNAKEFHEKHGVNAVKQVCEKLGTTVNYWKRVKGGHTAVSAERALALAKASDEVTGDPMTVVDLLGLGDQPERIIGRVRGAK